MAALEPIDATFRIVTPMFLGDADRKATRFRPESLKGVWRFWWRAIAWPEIFIGESQSEDAALAMLRKREIALFGGPSDKNGLGGKSPINFLPVTKKLETYLSGGAGGSPPRPWSEGRWHGLRYLGYGLISRRGGLERDGFRESQEVTVTFVLRPPRHEPAASLFQEELDRLRRSFKLMGLLGGLGSRKRRGFGSLTLKCIQGNGWDWARSGRPDGLTAYEQDLCELLPAPNIQKVPAAAEPPITAFGAMASVDLLPLSKSSAAEALNWIGQKLQLYRSWGYPWHGRHVISPKTDALQLFRSDHDFAQAPRNQPTFVPKRAAFGLPHAYEKQHGKLNVVPASGSGGAETTADGSSRRASPLLLHIHALEEDGQTTFAAAVTILPARFLPTQQNHENAVDVEQTVNVNGQAEKRRLGVRQFELDWSVLRGFLDGRKHPDPAKRGRDYPAFTQKDHGRVTVWPRHP